MLGAVSTACRYRDIAKFAAGQSNVRVSVLYFVLEPQREFATVDIRLLAPRCLLP